MTPALAGWNLGMKLNIMLLALLGTLGLFVLSRVLGAPAIAAAFAASFWIVDLWVPKILESGNYAETYFMIWPWLMVAGLKAGKRWWAIPVGAAAMALLLINGALMAVPACLFFGIGTLVGHTLDGGRRGLLRACVAVFLVVLLGTLLASPKLLPMLELLQQDVRAIDAASVAPWEPDELKDFLLLDPAIIVLAALGAISCRAGRWMLALAMLAAFLAFRPGWLVVDLFSLLRGLPLFGSIRAPFKYFIHYYSFFVCLAAAWGILRAVTWARQGRSARGAALLVAALGWIGMKAAICSPDYAEWFGAQQPSIAEAGSFYHVRWTGDSDQERPSIALTADNVLRGIGTMPARLDLAAQVMFASPRYVIHSKDAVKENPQYTGEVYLEPPEAGSARILSFTPNKIVVEVNARSHGWLHLNQTYHPRWRSSIGPVKESRGVVAITLEELGRQRVEFVYEQPLVVTGAWLASLGFGLCGLVAWRWRAARAGPPPAPAS